LIDACIGCQIGGPGNFTAEVAGRRRHARCPQSKEKVDLLLLQVFLSFWKGFEVICRRLWIAVAEMLWRDRFSC
jgi:hypothetical protein